MLHTDMSMLLTQLYLLIHGWLKNTQYNWKVSFLGQGMYISKKKNVSKSICLTLGLKYLFWGTGHGKKILFSHLFGTTYDWVVHHLQTKYLTKTLKIASKKRKNSICSCSNLAACNVACKAGSFFGVLFLLWFVM